MFNRKHHCRNCGAVVCDSCSRDKMLIVHVDPHKPVRVCSNCSRLSVADAARMQSSLASAVPTTPTETMTRSTVEFQAVESPQRQQYVTTMMPPSVIRSSDLPVFVPPTKKPQSPPPPPPLRPAVPPPPPLSEEMSSAAATSVDTSVPADHHTTQMFNLGELQDIVRQRRGSLLATYGIDITHKEMSLQDDDFVATFGCTKEDFQVCVMMYR